jgi:hypothetical protein
MTDADAERSLLASCVRLRRTGKRFARFARAARIARVARTARL